mmetsp:Transcript_6879/g.16927  ORF Transcript_6879/g.16927 Transcript_6879/m.16927 type:complete len:130 (-) Transcript_6879:657-1046(-)
MPIMSSSVQQVSIAELVTRFQRSLEGVFIDPAMINEESWHTNAKLQTPKPTKKVLKSRSGSSNIIWRIPPWASTDSFTGENPTTNATKHVLRNTFMLEVFSRSAISLCMLRGTMTKRDDTNIMTRLIST